MNLLPISKSSEVLEYRWHKCVCGFKDSNFRNAEYFIFALVLNFLVFFQILGAAANKNKIDKAHESIKV